MNQQSHKRRKKIIDPDFQYGLIRNTVILALLLIAASLISTALVYNVYGDMQVDVIQPPPFLPFEGLKPVEDQTILGLLWPIMTVSLLVTVVVTLVFGLVVSNRMAGPVYSMRRALREMAQGDLSSQISLRRRDAFKALADEINNLKQEWRLSIQELQQVCQQLDSVNQDKSDRNLKRLREILSRFKTT
jgi:HAMP domain-containing protein